MIDVKELRIGNYIKHKKGDVVQANIYHLSDIIGDTDISESIHVYEPIILTEGLLKKCDFNFNPKFADLSVAYGITKQTFHFVIGNYYKQIYHLHELQNIYFAMTGTELKINL